MAKINFSDNPTTGPDSTERLFTVKVSHPRLVRGLEITTQVVKDDVKGAVEDMRDILDEMDDD